jgi:hypothetical protein
MRQPNFLVPWFTTPLLRSGMPLDCVLRFSKPRCAVLRNPEPSAAGSAWGKAPSSLYPLEVATKRTRVPTDQATKRSGPRAPQSRINYHKHRGEPGPLQRSVKRRLPAPDASGPAYRRHSSSGQSSETASRQMRRPPGLPREAPAAWRQELPRRGDGRGPPEHLGRRPDRSLGSLQPRLRPPIRHCRRPKIREPSVPGRFGQATTAAGARAVVTPKTLAYTPTGARHQRTGGKPCSLRQVASWPA